MLEKNQTIDADFFDIDSTPRKSVNIWIQVDCGAVYSKKPFQRMILISSNLSVSLTPNNMNSIQDIENQIREFITSPRKQSGLLKISDDWNKLCSSLDLIGDTQLAIDSYPQFHGEKEAGASYLIVYGILQTLLLQQDATKHIGESLGIKVKLPKDLQDIRAIRNSTAGHPTHQKENGLSKSCFIVRNSISPTNFELISTYSNDYKSQQIVIPLLIKTQKKYVSHILTTVVTELERQEMEHRQKHKTTKLTDIFPHTIGYLFQKIFVATNRPTLFPFGEGAMKTIVAYMDSFKKELSDRGEWGIYDEIDLRYELIEYPLKRLGAYFKGNDDMSEKDAYIFASFLENQVNLLKDSSKELDDTYESVSETGR